MPLWKDKNNFPGIMMIHAISLDKRLVSWQVCLRRDTVAPTSATLAQHSIDLNADDEKQLHSNYETLTPCCFNVGPASASQRLILAGIDSSQTTDICRKKNIPDTFCSASMRHCILIFTWSYPIHWQFWSKQRSPLFAWNQLLPAKHRVATGAELRFCQPYPVPAVLRV